MQFSKFIPVSVKEQELSRKLISVFDGLQAYKEEIIYGSLRTTNFALIDDKKWLLKNSPTTDSPVFPTRCLYWYFNNSCSMR